MTSLKRRLKSSPKGGKKLIVHKMRLYPSDEQKAALFQMFGNSRFFHNKILSLCKETYELGHPYPGKFTLCSLIPQYKALYPFLSANSVTELRHVVDHADRGFQNFFAGRARFPRFKKRSSKQSLTCSQGTKLNGCLFSIEGLKGIPINLDKRSKRPGFPSHHPKLATISRSASGKYFASLTWETTEFFPETYTPTSVIGIDEGITNQIATSYGRKIQASKPFNRLQKKLRRTQRIMDRRKKGSRNRAKARIAVARVHEKITNTRKFQIHSFIHHEVRKAKDKNQAIAIQTSNKTNQLKNRKLSKALSDVSNGYLISYLKAKCQQEGVPVVEINQWEPTSSICHCCGEKNTTLSLANRKWRCEKCGILHDRDVNAARVIALKAQGKLPLSARGNRVNACALEQGRVEITKPCYFGLSSNGKATLKATKSTSRPRKTHAAGSPLHEQGPLTQESIPLSRHPSF